MAGFGASLQAAAPVLLGIGSQASGRDPAGIARGVALLQAQQERDKRKAAIDNLLSGMGIGGQQRDFLSTLPQDLQSQWVLQQMAPKPRNLQVINGQAVDMDTMQVVGDFRTPGAPVPSLADMGMGGPVATNEEFVAQMWPHALRVSQATGLDPRLVVAQSAQETGWGKHAPNNNYFGIKSHGRPGGATLATKEVYGGQPVAENASFRTYGGMGQSADDYAAFLQQNPRYGEMLAAKGLDAQLEALGRSGYATDPNYAASVGRIARSITPVGGMPAQQSSGPDAELAGINQRIQRFEQAAALGYDVSRYEPMYERLLKDRDRILGKTAEPDPIAALRARADAAGLEPGSPEYRKFMINGGAAKGLALNVGSDGSVSFATDDAAAGVKFNETEAKTNTFVVRARGALEVLDQVGAEHLTDRADALLERVPFGIGREAQSDDYQVAKQSGDEFLQAILRKDTGAAITPGEQTLYGGTYLPQPGDGDALLEAKRAARLRAVAAMEAGMSPAQQVAVDRAIIGSERRIQDGKPNPATKIAEKMKIDPTAITMLLDDPTDEQKANFDAVFGAGSAAQVLEMAK